MGATGPKGPKGATGLKGPAGPGYTFTTASGTDGPNLDNYGTYFVDVEAGFDTTGGSITGSCSVIALDQGSPIATFEGALNTGSGGVGGNNSFAGMLVIPSTANGMPVTLPVPTVIGCQTESGTTVTPTNAQWWVSPVG